MNSPPLSARAARWVRRILGLDQDRADLEARLESMARTLEEALAHSRRVHHVEALGERLRVDVQQRSEEQAARIEAAREAITVQSHADRAHWKALRAELAALAETQGAHWEAQGAHWEALRAELAALAQAQDARHETLLQLVRTLYHDLQQTRHALAAADAEAAADRTQLEAAITKQAQSTLASLSTLEQAQNLAIEAQAEGRRQSLQLLTRTAQDVGWMQTNMIRAPLYLQPGLTAVTRLGGADGHPLAVPTSHAGVLFSHYANGAESGEPGMRALIRAKVQPGQTAIDIGAHVGVHAVILGFQVGEGGRLFCFEPDPELAEALHITLLMNGMLHHTQVVAAAVAEAAGRMAFHRTPHSPESTLFPEPGLLHRDSIEVAVTSLDAAIPAGHPVHFIKIDAEGAEAGIYRG
ncbi:MAG: FkbM family methyltransferase, partial [Hyphomonadaceae bacterium]|nr:FkbM family methyltransferase [Hyphomonadaceae bacterium]